MKKLLVAFLILVTVSFQASAGLKVMVVGGVPAAATCAGSSCTGYEICQNFQTATTGYDNSETWTTWTGTPNPVDTTATVLRATQQLALDNGDRAYTTIAGSPAEGHLFFRYKAADGTPSAQFRFMKISYNGEGDDLVIAFYHRTDGNIRAYHGGTYATTTTTPLASDNTAVYIWVDFTLGTGANGTMDIYTSANSTKPGVGSKALEITNGAATSANSYDRVSLWNDGSATAQITYFDQVLFDTAATIGTVCD